MPITSDKAPDILPKAAKKIWAAAFNAAFDDLCQDRNDRDECAAKVAWSAVKKKYRKTGKQWVPKAALIDVNLVITKASLQEDGTLHWQATVSDVDPDRAGERTTLSLFQDWIERVEKGDIARPWLPPPRMPFLGVSHYPSLNGLGQAGATERMFIDGKQFKAAGVFFTDDDHPLGPILFRAVRAERDLIKRGKLVEEPIRISAAWWDLQHSHGDFVFTRRSLDDRCPMCSKGAGDKAYLLGQVDHLAATRVPMHPRTELGLEEKSMIKIKRRDDAASIIGAELADELEDKAQQLVGKSMAEGLVAKAKTKQVDGKRYQASDFLIIEDPNKPSTWRLPIKGDGKPDHRLMGAAWAALHQGYRGNKYEGPGKAAAIRKLKKLYKSEGIEPPAQKADVARGGNEIAYIPALGGATSLEEAEIYLKSEKLMRQVSSQWDIFNAVIANILNMQAEENEMESDLNHRRLDAIRIVASEFNDRINAVKANLIDIYLLQPVLADRPGPVSRSEKMNDQTNAVQPPAAANDSAAQLDVAIKAALENPQLARQAKLEAIQEALGEYAKSVKSQLDAVAPPAPAEEITSAIEKSLSTVLEPLAHQLSLLNARLGQPSASAIPRQKSFAPGQAPIIQDPAQGDSALGKSSSLTAMIRRSVGIIE